MAALQVLQRGVCDEGAVVQLDHLQAVVSAGAAAQVSDAVIRDQLAVRQALQEDQHRSSITQLSARTRCAGVWVSATGVAHDTHQDLQTRTVDRQLDECSIRDLRGQKKTNVTNCSLRATAAGNVFVLLGLFTYLHTFF